MKNILGFLVLVIIASILSSSSCETPPAPTREDFLTGDDCKTWVLKQITRNSEEWTHQEDQCLVDDEFLFCSSQKYQRTEGQVYCGLDQLVEDKFWSFNKEKTLLFINYVRSVETDTLSDTLNNNIYKKYLIEDLLKDYLKLTYDVPNSSPKVTYKYTFEPKP